jgi:DNA-directed RNA polymerase specialized sigma24 family protein
MMQSLRPSNTVRPTDRELAIWGAAGDQHALALIFDRYAALLLTFCAQRVPTPAAEDRLRDIFVLTVTHIGALREPAQLRGWLFAVARYACPAREQVSELSERDQVALELVDQFGLSLSEVGVVVGRSPHALARRLHRSRIETRREIGALIVAGIGRTDCTALDRLLRGWDGQPATLTGRGIAGHIDSCDTCTDHERRIDGLTPFRPGPSVAAVPAALRARILTAGGHHLDGSRRMSPRGWRSGWPPAVRPRRLI